MQGLVIPSIMIGGIELVFTVAGMYLINTARRKRLMAIGSGLMIAFALGISLSYANDYRPLMQIFVIYFTAAFAFSTAHAGYLAAAATV